MRIILVAFALALCCNSTLVSAATPPNVVVILTDDQGWGDLGCNGNTNLETPQIDSLARDGVTLEYFYVCQVCAPTRAEFLTGRYYPKTGVSGVSVGKERLNYDETTIAEHFQRAGYATGAFGKWHNGTQAPYHPNDRGFAEFYGFTSGHWGHYFSPPLDHNRSRVRGTGFIVDDCVDKALQFIGRHRSEPFFCYLPLNTPHSPMMVPDRFYDRFRDTEIRLRHRDPAREDLMMTRAALALCENIDWNVGRVLRTLEELALADNTIVIFFSDNGPNSFRWNGGMKGRKGSLDEGGLRSPCMIRWPRRLPEGHTLPTIAGAIDLFPTLCDLAGIAPPAGKPIDGESLAPLLSGGESKSSDRSLYAVKQDQVSVRQGRFRLDAQGRLFDVHLDPGQRRDVAGDHPQVAETLREQARSHRIAMRRHFEANADRPFTVGYAATTTLPARDGQPHGTIRRSSKAPNNSFFTHWTNPNDAITWAVTVKSRGLYRAIVYYTCATEDRGVVLQLATDSGTDSVRAQVTEPFDPPLYDKSKERVAKSHYFVKDFRPLELGELELNAGRCTLRLTADAFRGERAVDVHSLELVRLKGS